MKYFSIWCSRSSGALSDRVMSYIDNKMSVLDDFELWADNNTYNLLYPVYGDRVCRIPEFPTEVHPTILDEVYSLREPEGMELIYLVNRIDILKMLGADYTDRAYIDLDIHVNSRANSLDLPDGHTVFATHGTAKMTHMKSPSAMNKRIDAHLLYNSYSVPVSKVLEDAIVSRLTGKGTAWSKFGVELFSSQDYLDSELADVTLALNSYITSPYGWTPMRKVSEGEMALDLDRTFEESPMSIGVHLFNGSMELNNTSVSECRSAEHVPMFPPGRVPMYNNLFIPLQIGEARTGRGSTLRMERMFISKVD